MENNETLRQVVLMATAGELLMDTGAFQHAVLEGKAFAGEADLDYIRQNLDADELAGLARELGISDINTVSAEEFNARSADYYASGKADTRREFLTKLETIKGIKKSTNAIPDKVSSDTLGKRYKTKDADIAILKDGENYRIYNYETGHTTQAIPDTEVNRLLDNYHKGVAESKGRAALANNEINQNNADLNSETDESPVVDTKSPDGNKKATDMTEAEKTAGESVAEFIEEVNSMIDTTKQSTKLKLANAFTITEYTLAPLLLIKIKQRPKTIHAVKHTNKALLISIIFSISF